jgi:uncharacterized membrane protein
MTSTTNTSRSVFGRPGPAIGLGLLALSFAVPALFYAHMPEDVPSHWNAYGEMDGTIAKPIGPFVGALACAFVYALYLALPRLSPRGFDLDRFRAAYDAIMVSLVAAMAVVSVAVSLAAAGVALPMAPVIGVTIGVVFAVMGNYMGKVQRNFFVGIRTPWTLANEEVWLRTHRVAGKLFVASGVVLAVSSFFGPGLVVGVAFALVASFVPVVYSYVLHRKLET